MIPEPDKNTTLPISGKNHVFNHRKLTVDLLLAKSIVLYGESKSGKSFLTNEILTTLANEVYFMMVFSKTAYNDDYFPMTGYTETPLIYESLNMGAICQYREVCKKRNLLRKESREVHIMKENAKTLNKIYSDCNDIRRIEKLKKDMRSIKNFEKFHRKKATDKDTFVKIDNEVSRLYCYIMRKGLIFIKKNKIDITKYTKGDGSNTISILFSNININSIILFNDIGDELGNLTKKEKAFFTEFFTQGRHDGITIIFLAQDSTQLLPAMRKNVMINIFTEENSLMKFIDQNSTKHMRPVFKEAAEKILIEDKKRSKEQKKHTKVIYEKELCQVSYTVADKLGGQCKVGNAKLLKKIANQSIKKNRMILEDINGYKMTK